MERPPTTRLSLAARTDIGPTRMYQEDTFLVADLATGVRHGPAPVAAVLEGSGGVALAAIDSMGASFNGEEAGHLAAEALRAHLSAAPLPAGDAACRRRLLAAMDAATRTILEAIAAKPHRLGMGCAATLAVVHDARLHLAQLGDTRAYLLRRGRLGQVTRDHTLVEDARAEGASPELIATLPPGVITRALGMMAESRATVSTVELRAGDVLLVCSDGLTTVVDDATLERTLAILADPSEACLALLGLALRAPTLDNVTVIVARAETG